MNETLRTILHRRSVRRYAREQIAQSDMEAILQAGCAAPYGGPEPPVRFIVVRNEAVRGQLVQAETEEIERAWAGKPDEEKYWNLFFSRAPVLVAVLFRPASVGGSDAKSEERIGLCSAACAIQNLLLAAASLELGACWVGPMPEAKARFEEILGVASPWEFMALVALGRPAEPSRREKAIETEHRVQFLD